MSELKTVHNICQWMKKIYQRYKFLQLCKETCKENTENFHLLFPQFFPMITFDITVVHHQIQEIGIGTTLAPKL